MLTGATAELFNFVVVHKVLQINSNLQIIIICYRHRIEMERILRLEVAIEVDNSILQFFYRFPLLIDYSSQLADELLTVLMAHYQFVI